MTEGKALITEPKAGTTCKTWANDLFFQFGWRLRGLLTTPRNRGPQEILTMLNAKCSDPVFFYISYALPKIRPSGASICLTGDGRMPYLFWPAIWDDYKQQWAGEPTDGLLEAAISIAHAIGVTYGGA